MEIAVVDIECTGLDTSTVDIHCIVLNHITEGLVMSADHRDLTPAIRDLNQLIEAGVVIAGHNIIEYDFPILQRYGMIPVPFGQVYDSLVVSRAAYPGNTLYNLDIPFKLRHPEYDLRPGAHSLKAWGMRLGNNKGDYAGGWETFSDEMLAYCKQDVSLNVDVIAKLRSRIPDAAALLECDVATICRTMRLSGVGFDVARAVELSGTWLERREQLATSLKLSFPSWIEPETTKVPSRSLQSRKVAPGVEGYKNIAKGCAFSTFKVVEFNPASTAHIAHALTAKYGWVPTNRTPGGKPQVTAEVLLDLPYAECTALAEYQELKKVLGYISEGTNGWLKLEKNGRLHGKINPTGTVSGRAAHSHPNLGNVPTRSSLGAECRTLFGPSPGKVIVGADASGLQLRALAHYLALWDGGAFARQCETGDIHEYMRQATGLFTRAHQKTWTYAKLFGAGPGKLGATAIVDHRAAFDSGLTTVAVPLQTKARKLGRQTLDNLGDAIPAFTELEEMLALRAAQGKLTSLDGRTLPISSDHVAIAMLLQGFEAVLMKRALVIASSRLTDPDLVPAQCEFMLWVHDEMQAECLPEYADAVGAMFVESIVAAGEYYNVRVRLDGEYKVGKTWSDTH